MKRVLILLALGLLLPAAEVLAQPVPALINFQSQVLNPDGTPLATGDYELTFRIFDAAEGGTMIWGPQVLDGAGARAMGRRSRWSRVTSTSCSVLSTPRLAH